MKNAILISLALFFVFADGDQLIYRKIDTKIQGENRELLREYFLVGCLESGFGINNIREFDHSAEYLRDVMKYDLDGLRKVDEKAKKIVDSIPISPKSNKKGIISNCLEKYNSKEIRKFISSLDNHFVKDYLIRE